MIPMTPFRSLLMNSQVSVAQTQGRNRLFGPWNQFLQMQWFLWWWLRMATEQNSHALPKPRIASKPSTIRPALPKIIKVFWFSVHIIVRVRDHFHCDGPTGKKKSWWWMQWHNFGSRNSGGVSQQSLKASNWVWHCWSISGRPQWRQQQALNRSWKCNAKGMYTVIVCRL